VSILPLKIVIGHLILSGHLVPAIALFVAEKVGVTAVVGRLFTVAQPQLMKIGWLAKAYKAYMPWKDAVMDRIHNTTIYKWSHALKREMRQAVKGRLALLRQAFARAREANQPTQR
jgi:hypothetical protein